jgi:3-hydroxybutyryl-CoA dehydrogenase
MKEHIAVIGAGLISHGIAQVFAVAGHCVSVYDPVSGVLNFVPERVRTNLEALGLDPCSVDRITLKSTLAARRV